MLPHAVRGAIKRLPLPLLDRFARHYPRIVGRVHLFDAMLSSTSGADHYRRVGIEALLEIEASLREVGRSLEEVESCLDFACGKGRVLRWLQTRIEPARIRAADVKPGSVSFCRREFGVKPLLCPESFDELRFPESYDLVWVGSLLTHVPLERALTLLDALVGALAPGGVLVFTNQGESCISKLPVYHESFRGSEAAVGEALEREGHAFLPYPGESHYGIALHRQDFLEKLVVERFARGVQLVRFQARGWDRHQDVWSFQKVAQGAAA